MVVTTLLDEFALVNTIRKVCPNYLLSKIHTVNSLTAPCVQHDERAMTAQLVQQWDSADQLIVSLFLWRASLVTWVSQLGSRAVMSRYCGSIPSLCIRRISSWIRTADHVTRLWRVTGHVPRSPDSPPWAWVTETFHLVSGWIRCQKIIRRDSFPYLTRTRGLLDWVSRKTSLKMVIVVAVIVGKSVQACSIRFRFFMIRLSPN